MSPVVAPLRTAEAGEEEAARLFETYSEQLLGFCFRRLGSLSDAEDALQTTFLYALRALQRGVVPEFESTWLHVIATNVCSWQRRTLSRRGDASAAVDLDSYACRGRFGCNEELLGFKEALASLPERQRNAFVLRELRGFPCRDVALELGLTQPAADALLTRARRSLAGALEGAPARPLLGLASFLYELRSQIRTLLGGGTAAKTVALATVAATVAVGGVSTEIALDRGGRPAIPSHAPLSVQDGSRLGGVASGEARARSVTEVGRARERSPRLGPAESAGGTARTSRAAEPVVPEGEAAGTEAGESPVKQERPSVLEETLPDTPLELPLDMPLELPLDVPVEVWVEVRVELPIDAPPLPEAGLPTDPALPDTGLLPLAPGASPIDDLQPSPPSTGLKPPDLA